MSFPFPPSIVSGPDPPVIPSLPSSPLRVDGVDAFSVMVSLPAPSDTDIRVTPAAGQSKLPGPVCVQLLPAGWPIPEVASLTERTPPLSVIVVVFVSAPVPVKLS